MNHLVKVRIGFFPRGFSSGFWKWNRTSFILWPWSLAHGFTSVSHIYDSSLNPSCISTKTYLILTSFLSIQLLRSRDSLLEPDLWYNRYFFSRSNWLKNSRDTTEVTWLRTLYVWLFFFEKSWPISSGSTKSQLGPDSDQSKKEMKTMLIL